MSEHDSNTGPVEIANHQDRKRPNKRLDFDNHPPLEHYSSPMSGNNHKEGPQPSPLPKAYKSAMHGHDDHRYADLEQGIGPGSIKYGHKEDARSRTPEELDTDREDRQGGRTVRPPVFARTFTQQIRNAGRDPDLDFNNLSKEEKREMMRLPWFYLMDTKLKNGMKRYDETLAKKTTNRYQTLLPRLESLWGRPCSSSSHSSAQGSPTSQPEQAPPPAPRLELLGSTSEPKRISHFVSASRSWSTPGSSTESLGVSSILL